MVATTGAGVVDGLEEEDARRVIVGLVEARLDLGVVVAEASKVVVVWQ